MVKVVLQRTASFPQRHCFASDRQETCVLSGADQEAWAEGGDKLAALNGEKDDARVSATKAREDGDPKFVMDSFPVDEVRARGCFHWSARVFDVLVLV
jgi:hypothetical protein